MRIEPLPDIRNGVLVERLVKTLRYVAQMRRRQYVVQRPEGVRRRQRLNVEYVDRRAGDLPVLQHADQSLLFDDRPARPVIQLVQAPGRPGSFHEDPYPLFVANRRIGEVALRY